MMLGILMIITAICALCVQARIRWRQVTSQGESLRDAAEGALRAASQASEANRKTCATESALRAALQAQCATESAPRAALQAQIADPEPNPQSSCSSSSQKTLRKEATKASQNTAHPKADEQGSSEGLEPRRIFYSRDGMKVGIYHTSRNCGNLKSANTIFEKEFSRDVRKHRLCKICEHAKKA